MTNFDYDGDIPEEPISPDNTTKEIIDLIEEETDESDYQFDEKGYDLEGDPEYDYSNPQKLGNHEGFFNKLINLFL